MKQLYDNNRCGIFLLDGNKNIGASHVYQTDAISNIVHVYIDDNYRGKNYGDGVIETVIAGGLPVLKCFLRVVDKLNYNI